MADPSPQRLLHRLDRLGNLLDNYVAIPGTRFRVGLDGILGLIPGVGDLTGAALSGYIIVQAAGLGIPVWTLWRMLGNVLVESVVGVIPVVGDLFDIVWKANLKNLTMLREHAARGDLRPRSPKQLRNLVLVPLVVIAVTLSALASMVMVLVVRVLVQ